MWGTVLLVFLALPFLSFLLPFTYKGWLHGPQDLKKKYGAKWALVTGASSGIGKALVEKLAAQGLNVVLVALDDKLLKDTFEELQKKFPDVELRKVGADLSKDGYMKNITKQTDDILITLVFNNAGYMLTGMFADGEIDKLMQNYECNATSAVRITHHFMNKILDSGSKGLIAFTSSPAGAIPSPFAVLYSATKSFLTQFAVSLAPEVKSQGVDICVVHPSPVNSRFYTAVPKNHMISSISFFQSTGTGPETIANVLLANAGRTVMAEQGYFCLVVRGILLKLIDVALFADIMARTAHTLPDYKKVAVSRKKKA
mmetsp:Transcript_19090/g.46864  ORF Transcript_19090/g.46864 Transcript_19090/m.46864 type:complete len:314 (-) Transcript_19090:231-1172(-)